MNPGLKLLVAVLFLLPSLGAFSQGHLSITKVITPDTVQAGSDDTLFINVKNADTAMFNGTITVHMSVNAGSPQAIGSSTTILPPHAVETFNFTDFTYDNPDFVDGQNIVVVWPTGTGVTTSDSLTITVVVKINGMPQARDGTKNGFRLYPNPASSRVNIVSGTDYERVRILDPLGRALLVYGTASTLSLTGICPGFYFLELLHTDGSVSVARLVVK